MSYSRASVSAASDSARNRSTRLRVVSVRHLEKFSASFVYVQSLLDVNLKEGLKVGSLIVAILILNIFPTVGLAWAEPGLLPPSESSQTIEFEIPAEPLELALNAYGEKTKIQLFVDAAMISGLRSGALKGSFAPEDALAKMLAGTGLTVRAIGDQGFTLVRLSTLHRSDAAYPSELSAGVMRFNQYSGGIQNALRSALCLRQETASGSYRALVRFRINASGTVIHSELISPSGDYARDAVLSAAVQSLTPGSPPAGLPQPVTLLIVSDEMSAYCFKNGDSSREARSSRELAR